jgi:hypothetical protein
LYKKLIFVSYLNIKNNLLMRKILSMLAIAAFFSSCEQDIQTNTPGFQAKLNDVQWRGINSRVAVDANGGMTITSYTPYETVELKTSATSVGTYLLGTQNTANFATYTSVANSLSSFAGTFDTRVVEGPAYKLSDVLTAGTGYTSAAAAHTSGGSGSGLRLALTTLSGAVTKATVVSRGLGYVAGDVITILGGNNNATLRIENVQQSNGEITIEDISGGLFTGTFKLNATNTNGEVVTFSEGHFYKVPLGE